MRETAHTAWPALALALVLCCPWLGSPMFLDDWHNLLRAQEASWSAAGLANGFSFLDQSLLDSWNLPEGLNYHFFRPLLVASFKLDLAIWGTASFGFHLTNLVIHLGSIFLVTGIALRLCRDRRVARLGAIFWAVSPPTAVAVIFTSGRTELLVTLWMLAGFWCYVVARDEERPLLLLPALAFQLLACLSKESAVLFPVMTGAYELTIARARAGSLSVWLGKACAYLAPVVALAAGYLVYRMVLFDSGPLPGRPYFYLPSDSGFVEFAGAKILYYLFALVTGAYVLPLLGVEFLLTHLWALAGLFGATFFLYYVIAKKAGREPFHRFLWLVLAGSFLPTLPTLATGLYLYFGSIAIALLLASAFTRPATASAAADTGEAARPPRRWLRYALVGYVVFFAIGHLGRSAFYRLQGGMSERMYEEVVAEAPQGMPDGTRIYLINMPFVCAHIAPMLRLREGIDDVRAVLVSISTQWGKPTLEPKVDCAQPNRLRIWPPGSRETFFSTREEWYLQQLMVPFHPHVDYRTAGATVRPVTDGDRVIALDLILDGPSSGDHYRVYAFFEEGGRLVHRVCGPDARNADEPVAGAE